MSFVTGFLIYAGVVVFCLFVIGLWHGRQLAVNKAGWDGLSWDDHEMIALGIGFWPLAIGIGLPIIIVAGTVYLMWEAVIWIGKWSATPKPKKYIEKMVSIDPPFATYRTEPAKCSKCNQLWPHV